MSQKLNRSTCRLLKTAKDLSAVQFSSLSANKPKKCIVSSKHTRSYSYHHRPSTAIISNAQLWKNSFNSHEPFTTPASQHFVQELPVVHGKYFRRSVVAGRRFPAKLESILDAKEIVIPKQTIQRNPILHRQPQQLLDLKLQGQDTYRPRKSVMRSHPVGRHFPSKILTQISTQISQTTFSYMSPTVSVHTSSVARSPCPVYRHLPSEIAIFWDQKCTTSKPRDFQRLNPASRATVAHRHQVSLQRLLNSHEMTYFPQDFNFVQRNPRAHHVLPLRARDQLSSPSALVYAPSYPFNTHRSPRSFINSPRNQPSSLVYQSLISSPHSLDSHPIVRALDHPFARFPAKVRHLIDSQNLVFVRPQSSGLNVRRAQIFGKRHLPSRITDSRFAEDLIAYPSVSFEVLRKPRNQNRNGDRRRPLVVRQLRHDVYIPEPKAQIRRPARPAHCFFTFNFRLRPSRVSDSRFSEDLLALPPTFGLISRPSRSRCAERNQPESSPRRSKVLRSEVFVPEAFSEIVRAIRHSRLPALVSRRISPVFVPERTVLRGVFHPEKRRLPSRVSDARLRENLVVSPSSQDAMVLKSARRLPGRLPSRALRVMGSTSVYTSDLSQPASRRLLRPRAPARRPGTAVLADLVAFPSQFSEMRRPIRQRSRIHLPQAVRKILSNAENAAIVPEKGSVLLQRAKFLGKSRPSHVYDSRFSEGLIVPPARELTNSSCFAKKPVVRRRSTLLRVHQQGLVYSPGFSQQSLVRAKIPGIRSFPSKLSEILENAPVFVPSPETQIRRIPLPSRQKPSFLVFSVFSPENQIAVPLRSISRSPLTALTPRKHRTPSKRIVQGVICHPPQTIKRSVIHRKVPTRLSRLSSQFSPEFSPEFSQEFSPEIKSENGKYTIVLAKNGKPSLPIRSEIVARPSVAILRAMAGKRRLPARILEPDENPAFSAISLNFFQGIARSNNSATASAHRENLDEADFSNRSSTSFNIPRVEPRGKHSRTRSGFTSEDRKFIMNELAPSAYRPRTSSHNHAY